MLKREDCNPMNVLMPDEQQITQYTINNMKDENKLKIFNSVLVVTKLNFL